MTQAELITATRNLVNEVSTDAGALLSDAGNLLDFLNDALEQVTLDLLPVMPDQFLTSELLSLTANVAYVTPSNTYLWITKVEKYVTNDTPKEIEIIDQLQLQYYTKIGETSDEPRACYFLGNVPYFVPTPASNKTNYARLWGVRMETTGIPSGGPTYLPAVAHRLIAYKAAIMVATMLEADFRGLASLYAQRLESIKRIWWRRYQQKPRFVRESAVERTIWDTREKAFYDLDWPW